MALASNSFIKVLIFLIFFSASAQKPKKDQDSNYVKCTKWAWFGYTENRRVICLKWEPLDCSNRLHKDICRLEGKKIK